MQNGKSVKGQSHLRYRGTAVARRRGSKSLMESNLLETTG